MINHPNIGFSPQALLFQKVHTLHSPRELDLRSLRLHQLVAAKIRADPSLFLMVKRSLEAKLKSASPASLVHLVQWVNIFLDEALAAAVEDSARGQTLRSASPFAGVLTEQERLRLLWTTR